MKENIYIDLDEDVQSIIQKIQDSEADSLDLMIPTGARVLQNIVDAHLLKEAGDEYEKKLIVVTSDLMGRIFAERAGLMVLAQTEIDEDEIVATEAVSTGRISDIVPRRRGVPVRKSVVQKPIIKKYYDKEDKILKSKSSKKPGSQNLNSKSKGEIGASFLKSYREERNKTSVFKELSNINRKKRKFPFKISPTVFVAGVSVFALFIGFIVVTKTLPKAEIIIYPVRTQESKTIEILVSSTDSKADFEKGIIPGEILTLEKYESGEFQATGSVNSSEKAIGKITVYNAYSAQAQNFVASRFQSENGKIFWTTKPFSIPGMKGSEPGKVEIDVVAAETGDSYGIGPSKFTMPALKGTAKGEKIYGISTSNMNIAKSDGEKIVSNDDINKAYDSLKEKIKPQLQTLKQDLPAGFQLWSETYSEKLVEASSNPDVGGVANKFIASVKMIAKAIVFKSDDLESYMNNKISSSVGEGKIFLINSKEVSFINPPVIDYQKGVVKASLNVKYDIIDNQDVDGFKNAVLNKNKKEINKITSAYKNIERIEVKYSVFFMRSVPADSGRVKITVAGL
jgi:hypothetical protein